METIYYSLRINKNGNEIKTINNILNTKSISNDIWIYELAQNEKDNYINFIDIFTNILNEKIDLLKNIWIQKNDISIWILCNFEEQCNLEFSSNQINNLSKIWVWLNISCY